MSTVHRPVMAAECLRELSLEPGMAAVDGTAGGGGHSRLIYDAVSPGGRLIAVDRDPTMLERAKSRFGDADGGATFYCGPYTDLPAAMTAAGVGPVDAILVDLGLSSDQLADRGRGFGFQTGGPLDLRFNAAEGRPAWQWLRDESDETVATALAEYGDIDPNGPVSRAIVAGRRDFRTTEDVVAVVEQAGRGGRTHPATVVLQALRIVVNDELSIVRRAVSEVFPRCLRPGGRLVVLTFHSGEDRIVKRAMADKDVWTLRQKKPILPRPAEVRANPRSRSAKLRVAIRRGES